MSTGLSGNRPSGFWKCRISLCSTPYSSTVVSVTMKNPLTSMACSFTYQDRTTGSDQGPYVLGLVELVGGVRIFTNFVECVSREVTIGMPVEVKPSSMRH